MAVEYAAGGTVADLRKDVRSLGDEDAAQLVKSILLGLKHIHNHNYVHRDIKPSNIVLKNSKDYKSVKLVDFGLAVKYQTRQGIDESCGTLVYQAPEQMAGGQMYGKSVDIWAVGLIMFEVIKGKHPLWAKNETVESYRKKVMNFTGLRFNSKFSPMAKNLIEKLCHPKPSLRYTVDQAL
jgi:serine/threonine protein kinase